MTVSPLVPLGPAYIAVATAMHARCFEELWDVAALGALLAMPGAFGWIASDEGLNPAGMILCRVAADECEVLTVCVLPERCRRGVARRLLEAACEEAARAGASAMFLEVAADNESAGRLYRSAYFSAVGHRRGYYSRPETAVDAIILRRDLSPQLS